MATEINLMRLRSRIADMESWLTRTSLSLGLVRLHDGRQLADGHNPHGPDLDDGQWRVVREGDLWGGRDVWALFRVHFQTPADWGEQVSSGHVRARVVMALSGDPGPGGLGGSEALAYLDSVAYHGLDPNHREIALPPALCDGSTHLLSIEAYSGPRPQQLAACRLELVDTVAERVYYDLLAGIEVVQALPAGNGDAARLLALLVQAENLIDRRAPGSNEYFVSMGHASDLLAERLAELAAACASERPQVALTGHAHIDTAWLWTLDQTRRKVARSWSTALRLMERFPEYVFLASQPQQYAWLEEDEPHLLAQITQRVKEGIWEPGGAMWVEPDVLITSGESLVRQLLFGQRFLRDHFGVTCRFLWLPDTFGYSPALPQILRGCGVEYFITSKISWSETNQLPHDVFQWRGLDGSEVLSWLLTTPLDARSSTWVQDPGSHLKNISTYNGGMTGPEILGTWERFHDKALTQTTLCAFGFGDGGGGPTERMLELARRFEDLPGLPRARMSRVDDFMDTTREALAGQNPAHVPVWDGELYLEYHRGTYTSQGWIKRANRWAEHLYHDAEIWAAWAGLIDGQGSQRQQRLNQGREIILRNQFHDILPGSSIASVYVDARREHAEAAVLAEAVRDEAQAALVGGAINGKGQGSQQIVAFNGVPWQRDDPWAVQVAAGHVVDGRVSLVASNGAAVDTQVIASSDGTATILVAAALPGLGYCCFELGGTGTTANSADPAQNALRVSTSGLENDFFRLELDSQGLWSSLLDKRFQRQVLAAGGGGNALIAYEDKPLEFDAWDINAYYVDKPWPITDITEIRVVERGPVRGSVEIVRRYRSSMIRQRIQIYATTPRIDVVTEIDWHERQTLLKVAFPLRIRSTRATYECAFGHVERPTHRNTSWDTARFEVPGHRWADLSETGYGVSLLNDGKYGHDCLGNVLRLTLLKSAIYPDPLADEGEHRFIYSILPHGSDWSIEETVRQAYCLNLPARAVVTPAALPANTPADGLSLVTCDRPQVVIDTVKVAEDGDGLIVRLYDCAGSRGLSTLMFGRPIQWAEPCTMLEEPLADNTALAINGQSVQVQVAPFQVRSLRVRLA